MPHKELPPNLMRWTSSARVVAEAAIDLGSTPKNVQALKHTLLFRKGLPWVDLAQELKNLSSTPPLQPPESNSTSPDQE